MKKPGMTKEEIVIEINKLQEKQAAYQRNPEYYENPIQESFDEAVALLKITYLALFRETERGAK